MQTATVIFLCLTCSLSFILNMLGICTLSNLRHELTNQRILLINLSISELLYTSGLICFFFIDQFQHLDRSTFRAIVVKLILFFRYLYLISPLLLAVDRFIAIAFPWKYRTIFTKTKAVIMVTSIWICITSTAGPALLLNDYNYETARLYYTLALTIGVTVVVFAIVAYTVIALIVFRQRKLTARAKRESKILKVASAIIVTYIFLEVIPSMVRAVLFNCCRGVEKTYGLLFFVPTSFNTISDPIIYIYNYPPLKTAVKKKLMPLIGKLGCLQERSYTIAVRRPVHLSDTPL